MTDILHYVAVVEVRPILPVTKENVAQRMYFSAIHVYMTYNDILKDF